MLLLTLEMMRNNFSSHIASPHGNGVGSVFLPCFPEAPYFSLQVLETVPRVSSSAASMFPCTVHIQILRERVQACLTGLISCAGQPSPWTQTQRPQGGHPADSFSEMGYEFSSFMQK